MLPTIRQWIRPSSCDETGVVSNTDKDVTSLREFNLSSCDSSIQPQGQMPVNHFMPSTTHQLFHYSQPLVLPAQHPPLALTINETMMLEDDFNPSTLIHEIVMIYMTLLLHNIAQ